MGLSLRKLFKAREKPGEDVQRVSSVEIADQQVRDAVTEICLRELAFWTCVGKIANALTKCEFRTFYEGEELFKDEYYLWNYEPNRNQNKAEFLSKAMEQLFRNNELLIVESYDGQLLVADDFSVTKNALYGDTYTNVQVDDYTFSRSFRSADVLHWTLNNKNVNRIIQRLYDSYSKLIDYSAKSYLKSRGSRGILEISAVAQSDKLFNEKLEKLMNEYFKSFFESPNAVLPLFEGYSYTDIGSKTYSEGTSRDIKSQYDDIFDFTARGFSMPPTLAKGDVQDTEKAVDEMLTFCLDPLAQMLMQEINRKRIGKNGIQKGTKLQIDTMRVKHIDMFDIATSADKLISSGIYTVNMILRALGEIPIDEDWADQHFITKNYSTIQEILEEQKVIPALPILVTKLKVSTKTSAKIAAGKKIALKANISPANATNKALVWTSSNPKAATVNANGVVTMKKGSGGKKVTITAKAADGSGKKAVYTITGMKGVVKKVTISGKKTVKAGKSIKLKAKVKATKKANTRLFWKSSNQKFATVKNGKVKAKKNAKGKKVKITAMATDGSGKKKSVTIKIR